MNKVTHCLSDDNIKFFIACYDCNTICWKISLWWSLVENQVFKWKDVLHSSKCLFFIKNVIFNKNKRKTEPHVKLSLCCTSQRTTKSKMSTSFLRYLCVFKKGRPLYPACIVSLMTPALQKEGTNDFSKLQLSQGITMTNQDSEFWAKIIQLFEGFFCCLNFHLENKNF